MYNPVCKNCFNFIKEDSIEHFFTHNVNTRATRRVYLFVYGQCIDRFHVTLLGTKIQN